MSLSDGPQDIVMKRYTAIPAGIARKATWDAAPEERVASLSVPMANRLAAAAMKRSK